MVQAHLAEKGVEDVYLEEKVQTIDRAEDGSLTLTTDRRSLAADLIIIAAGLVPNSELARAAGLALTESGAVRVNSRFQTSDPDVYAGGDCIENMHLVTGRPVYMPSGSLANRHGRIIGTNLSGAVEEFDGVVGSFIMKCFDLAVGAVGLSLARARAEGFDAFATLIVQGDRAHFYPGMDLMYLELVADRATGRVLGLQGLSGVGEALSARINAVAGLLKYKPLLRDVSNLELAYAPPYSAAMDVLNALANTAENVMAGKCRTIGAAEFAAMLEREDKNDFVCLDVRGWANAEPYVREHPEFWINVPQDELKDRLDEVPRDKELILVCNSGVRSYEAQVALDRLEIGPCRNLEGGIAAIKKRGLKIVRS
jgi:rhodanese-related sulfurtransferase